MNQKAYKALEYYKIINMLTDKASSSMGKEICKKTEPSTDIDEIRHMQTQTKDALTRLFQKGNISFGSVKDVRGSLKRLEIGSSLGIRRTSCHLQPAGEYQPCESLFQKRTR